MSTLLYTIGQTKEAEQVARSSVANCQQLADNFKDQPNLRWRPVLPPQSWRHQDPPMQRKLKPFLRGDEYPEGPL